MRVTAAGVVADALRLFRRDRALLVAVAGPFWFLPSYAIALLIPTPPAGPPEGESLTAAVERLQPWMEAQAPWYLAAWAIGLWGTATVYALYLHGDRPNLRAALGGAALLWPRLLLASALGAVAAATLGLGWILSQPFLLLEEWVRTAGGGNPVAVAIVGAGAATVAAGAALASALLAVTAYLRVVR